VKQPLSSSAIASLHVATGPVLRDTVVADRPATAGMAAAAAALLVLVYQPTLAWLVERWTISVWHNAHGALVLPVALWLMWQELRPTWRAGPASSAWGWLFVVPALLLHVLDLGMHTQLLSAVSFVVLLPGLSLLLLGASRTRRPQARASRTQRSPGRASARTRAQRLSGRARAARRPWTAPGRAMPVRQRAASQAPRRPGSRAPSAACAGSRSASRVSALGPR